MFLKFEHMSSLANLQVRMLERSLPICLLSLQRWDGHSCNQINMCFTAPGEASIFKRSCMYNCMFVVCLHMCLHVCACVCECPSNVVVRLCVQCVGVHVCACVLPKSVAALRHEEVQFLQSSNANFECDSKSK